MNKKITIYTTNACAYCDMVKRFLASKGLSFTVVNLDEEEPSVRQRVIEMSGAMTVPVTVVESLDHERTDITIGWNPSKLAAAVA